MVSFFLLIFYHHFYFNDCFYRFALIRSSSISFQVLARHHHIVRTHRDRHNSISNRLNVSKDESNWMNQKSNDKIVKRTKKTNIFVIFFNFLENLCLALGVLHICLLCALSFHFLLLFQSECQFIHDMYLRRAYFRYFFCCCR